MDLPAFVLQRTLLVGSIPAQLFRISHRSKVFLATQVLHAGTIPASASRMSTEELHVTFGVGLTGPLPSFQGTLHLLSCF
eukprot:6434386-Amphidinium_carterae.1